MADKSTYFRTAVLNVLRGTNITAPGTTYVALFVGGTEVTGGSYARQEISFSAPTGTDPKTMTHADDVVFPEATADWGTVTDFKLMDALTSGNILYEEALDTSRTVNDGTTFQFDAGAIIVTEH